MNGAYTASWLAAALVPACFQSWSEGGEADRFDDAPPATDAEFGAPDAVDSGPDVPEPDAYDVGEDGGGDAGDRVFPDASATCDERMRFLLDYAAAHDDCSGGEECVPAVPVRGETGCNPSWIMFRAPAPSELAVTADAATDELLRLLERAVAECCSGYYPHEAGDGWWCAWAADMRLDFSAACESGTCVGRRTPGMGSCWPDGGAGGR